LAQREGRGRPRGERRPSGADGAEHPTPPERGAHPGRNAPSRPLQHVRGVDGGRVRRGPAGAIRTLHHRRNAALHAAGAAGPRLFTPQADFAPRPQR